MGHCASHAKEREPAGLAWRSHTLFILSTVAVGLFSDGFLYNLVVPVLPFMLEDGFDIPTSEIQSYTSMMLAVFAGSTVVSCLLAGLFAEKISSRRTPFLFALVCLLSATIMLFFGKTITVLIVARVLQGMSSAFVWTIGLAMCVEAVGIEHMGKTMGTILSFTSVGSLLAPFAGGALYVKAGVQGVAAVAISIVGIDLVLRVLVIEKKERQRPSDKHCRSKQFFSRQNGRTDHEVQPLLGKVHQNDQRFQLPSGRSWIVRRIPVLPYLTDPSLLAALLGSLVQAILMGSFDSTVAVVAHELFGFDSFKAGILFLPMGIANIMCGHVIGWMIDRHGSKMTAVFSFGILVPVLVSLRLVHSGEVPEILLFASLLTLAGVGLAGSGTPSIVEAGAVIDRYHRANPWLFGESGPYAMIYGMNGMVFNAGLTIGPELAGTLKDSIGYGNMNLILAGLSGITACVCFFWLGGKPQTKREDDEQC